MPRRPLPLAAAALVAALAHEEPARADTGPVDAIKQILNDSPTLGVVTGSVVIAADVAETVAAVVLASRGKESDSSLLWTQFATSTPQAFGFALAPFFFDISEWKPAENLALLIPFQAWSAALLTDASWSLAEPGLTPSARLGVSFFIGGDYALTATMIGCLSWGKWSPVEVASVEVGYGVLESAFAIERIATDVDHRPEWGLLTAWAVGIAAHGVGSLVGGKSSSHSSDAAVRGERRRDFAAMPWVTPIRSGAMVGVGGAF